MINARPNTENKKPVLIVMAGGLGSRYGGLKQIDPVTEQGEIILDFSLFDAHRAGFDRAILIIREETKEDFDARLDNGARKYMQVDYAFQSVDDLPEGYNLSANREKPWGTAHAIMAARDIIDAPFAVINADDYYGVDSFKQIYKFLDGNRTEGSYAMVSYVLKNTVTENGHVARGICQISDDGYLVDIVERTQIAKKVDSIEFTEDGDTWTKLDPDTPVSMNFWGYTPTMMREIENRFEAFLRKAENNNILKDEYLIPRVTDEVIKEGNASCKVLVSKDKWYGVTYKEDKDSVVEALAKMKENGKYPEKLWK
ncbi:MAG: sugar phosphate nucleotidyltransferase [Eubacteriales bacterium]|nr:sugar phosphate nucleotidyltransferase [Eubacteriales bacterium]